MMKKRFVMTAIALSVATMGAHAQSTEALQKALAQAQEAAAQAQAAAALAQAALAQALAAADRANSASAPAAKAPVPVALQTTQEGEPLKGAGSGVELYSNNGTSMRIYGLLEATVSDASHQNAAGDSAIGFQTAYFSGNRLGFDIDHALPMAGMPDLKVMAKLETEFELPSGGSDTNGILFNRDAWLGFYSDSLGKVTLGRQNTLSRDFTANWGDAFGGAEVSLKEGGYSNVNNFKQFIFYSGDAGGTRVNSGIEWKRKFGDHLVAGLGHAFNYKGNGGSSDPGVGGSVPGDFSDYSSNAASVAMNGMNVGVSTINANLSYNNTKIAGLSQQDVLVGGNFVTGPFRVNAGLVHYTAQQGVNNSMGNRVDNSWTTSGSWNFTPQSKVYLGYQVMKGTNAGFHGTNIANAMITDLSGVTATASGSKTSIYTGYIYSADKQTDFYIALDTFKTSGGWVVGDAQGNGMSYGAGQKYSGTTETAVGVRYKF